MKAAKIDNNIVTSVIEIPDLEDAEINHFINDILNLDGFWVSDRHHMSIKNIHISPGFRYIKDLNIFIRPQPFPSWQLDENYEWQAPEKNLLRNPLYAYERESDESDWFYWNEDRKKWGINNTEEFIKQENKRTNGLFYISKAIDVQPYEYIKDIINDINVVCNPRAFKYHEAHPDWEPGFVYPIFRKGGYGEKYGITEDNPDRNYSHEFCQIIYDAAPYFYISYTNLCDLRTKYDFNGRYRKYIYECSEELEIEHMQQYPFISARTLTELFRLIIDWDNLFHNGNTENTAKLCHEILSTIEMPDSIYDEILECMPDSVLLNYINSGSLYIPKPDERPNISSNITNWLADKYWDFRNLKYHDHINVTNYSNDHYR